jgi:perosamine synthetase
LSLFKKHPLDIEIKMNKFIPVNTPLFGGNEKKYLNECIDSGWISSEGPFIKKFEDSFAKSVGRKYAVAVTNGTAAIDVAITVLGIKAGDEVIIPTFTIISCVMQIIRIGAIPVFVDCERDTWNMNVNEIESKITSKTKAVMIVHIYGLPVDVDPILRIAKKYNLKVIEDAAEMHGQTYKNKPCGSFGDVSTFSFYPNKHITTGEGGMIVTNNEEFYSHSLSLRNLCFQPEKRRFLHEELGWNLRMTNMQAAIGLAQLERLDEAIIRKREIGRNYNNLLAGLGDYIQLPVEKLEYADNIYWVYGIVLNKNLNINAEIIMKALADEGIGTRPFFYPMHMQPVVKNYGLNTDFGYPNSEYISEFGFYLPSGLGLLNNEIEEAGLALIKVLNRYI